jgi:hypothetical protein
MHDRARDWTSNNKHIVFVYTNEIIEREFLDNN